MKNCFKGVADGVAGCRLIGGWNKNKKAQLSLANPHDAKVCQNCSNSTWKQA